jgi:NadR type nicotinamide-nucleotide adenylyltransferase
MSELDQGLKPFKRGLVVGKFSPLHRGHELVIRRAFEMCAEVVVISYSNPELPGCEAARREQWLSELFPRARRLVVTDQWLHERFSRSPESVTMPANAAEARAHRRFTGFLCLQALGTTVDGVFTSEDYGDGFAQELTKYFREHDPAAPEVRHVLVDRARQEAPISGTLIRADLETHRHWLSPCVYASFVPRICILGGESSGKSTLAKALGERFGTLHVPEYGRKLWEMRKGALTFEDMLHIGETQVAAEEQAARAASRFLFCDTSPLTTLFYSRHLFERADAKLELLAERRYDLVVLCETDFDFVQDGTRQDASFRERQHAWYLAELTRRGMPFLRVTGTVAERIVQIAEKLNGIS